MNKTASKEWLRIAYHDLKSAQILFEADHYTDSIGNDLQQSLEKILKSILAFQNAKIPKTHDLFELYDLANNFFTVSNDEIEFFEIATEYFKEDRYPNPNYCLPSKEEIEKVLYFTEQILEDVCKILNINIQDIKN